MPTTRKLMVFYVATSLFAVANIYLLTKGIYWFTAAPIAFLVMTMLFFSLDKLILLLVFLTPFSFTYEHAAMGFTVDMPTEPLFVAIMMLFFFKLIYDGQFNKELLRHPVSIFILLGIVWVFITSVTSEIPLVSFKFFVSRLWFVVVFFFLGVALFRDKMNIHRYFWLFGIALAVVVVYATYNHAQYAFDRQMGYLAVRPFFNDHTHYGAVLALISPFFLVMALNRSLGVWMRRLALLLFLVFAIGILFSYSRAAWLSLIIALGSVLILVWRIGFRTILAGLVLMVTSLFVFQTEIVMHLQRNTQESSADFSEHARSISNISSDASNLERINRWRSAIRMFEERPVLGWGPGTYQFVYAPFQRSEDYTIITTHFGDLGNAHSEYLGPLSESGLPGMILFLSLALAALATGVRLYKKADNHDVRMISLGITLGLITYFTHGFLNNFLDTDEASVLFWGMMAALVAMDARQKKIKNSYNGNHTNTFVASYHSKVQV